MHDALGREELVNIAREFNVPNMSVCFVGDTDTNIVINNSDLTLDQTTLFNACSMSKMVTALLVIKLVNDGKLSLDETIEPYCYWQAIDKSKNYPSIRDLLSHTGGLHDPIGSFEVLQLEDKAPQIDKLLKGESKYCKGRIDPEIHGGKKFEYSDAGYLILETIVEQITGKSFVYNAKTMLFEPLNMIHSVYPMSYDECDGANVAYGFDVDNKVLNNKISLYPYPSGSGLWSTTTDLAKIVSEIINIQKGKSLLGISKKLYEEMTMPPEYAPYAGLGVFIDDVNHHLELSSLGWGEGYQSGILIYPDLEKAIIVMTNKDSGMHQYKGAIGKVFSAWINNHK